MMLYATIGYDIILYASIGYDMILYATIGYDMMWLCQSVHIASVV